MTPHDYIHTNDPTNEYFWVVFCRKCGYIAGYGNDSRDVRAERQRNLPISCIEPAAALPSNTRKDGFGLGGSRAR
jgi:hypothetical protein